LSDPKNLRVELAGMLGRQTPGIDLRSRAQLIEQLIVVFHTMRTTEHLLQVAGGAAAPGSRLRRYYAEHLIEERGHARLLAEDLASVGIDVLKLEPPADVLALIGSIYYELFHVSAAALLGWQCVAEWFPLPLSTIGALEDLHGKKLLRTLRLHSEIDPHHGTELEREIARLPDADQAVVARSAKRSLVYLLNLRGRMCRSLAA